MADESTTIDATLPGGTALKITSKFMAELISVGCLVMTCIGGYVLWQQTKVLEKLDMSVKEMASASRETACIISLPAEKREQQYQSSDSFCKRMAKMQ